MQPESLGLEKHCGVGGGGCAGGLRCPPHPYSDRNLTKRGIWTLPVSCITEEVQFHENIAIFFFFFWSTESKCFSSLYLRVSSNLPCSRGCC